MTLHDKIMKALNDEPSVNKHIQGACLLTTKDLNDWAAEAKLLANKESEMKELFEQLLKTLQHRAINNTVAINNVDLFVKAWRREAELMSEETHIV